MSSPQPLMLFLLLSLSAAAAAAPDWAPFNEQLCQDVECGKGKCVSNSSYPFNFICECDAGWKRTRLDNEDGLKFLPCVIPNCSVQYSCMPAPPPLPAVPYNLSFFDPCYWIYCGGGTCSKSAPYAHTCNCNTGYTNLMNVSVFPCFSDCAIGSDCSKLGIKVSSSTASSNSDNTNHANKVTIGRMPWVPMIMSSLALLLKSM
ncbi:hypothetical protein MLD38_038674 [Melastoma candidum]|uniref:Uncharacterized protein n=1 Tax=Melastoma candidum TaxID=119954 RepID=A0ACB9L0V5_9MYRT|nr:hypothetical protein MLD38_038674 [Melastoma candidum]